MLRVIWPASKPRKYLSGVFVFFQTQKALPFQRILALCAWYNLFLSHGNIVAESLFQSQREESLESPVLKYILIASEPHARTRTELEVTGKELNLEKYSFESERNNTIRETHSTQTTHNS